MPYEKVKIYSDGSHYIGIPPSNRPQKKRSTANKEKEEQEIFEKVYHENSDKKNKEKKEILTEKMQDYFGTEEEAKEFVDKNLYRLARNRIVKRIRLWRKVNLQEWNYFATFTYNSKKHSEESFKKSLSCCMRHFSSRKEWRYVGVWERSPEKQRLHFHCLLYVPDGAMKGELIEVKGYDTKSHKRQLIYQNTYFNSRFGRNDFEPIVKQEIAKAVSYLVKYIEKTGEKIVYSRGLPQYFVSDVMEKDIVCTCGIDDRKIILSDKFDCLLDGEYIGEVCKEVIEQLPKSN